MALSVSIPMPEFLNIDSLNICIPCRQFFQLILMHELVNIMVLHCIHDGILWYVLTVYIHQNLVSLEFRRYDEHHQSLRFIVVI